MTRISQRGYDGQSYAMPDYAVALFFGVWKELSRIYWNREQELFDEDGQDDPKIPGLEVYPYWGERAHPEDSDEPQFRCRGVDIYWYKHPGRGMRCNLELDCGQWIAWFDATLDMLREHEKENDRARRTRSP